jgi:hypothetical protein
MGRRPLTLGLARTERIEAKITPAEREALTARRGNMTESDAIRAAVAAWCSAGPLDAPLDVRLVDLVEQAVARGFMLAMQGRNRDDGTFAHADPIAREERAAVLRALQDESEGTLAQRLSLSPSLLAAIRNMKPRAPRLTDEQRVELGLTPRQLEFEAPEPSPARRPQPRALAEHQQFMHENPGFPNRPVPRPARKAALLNPEVRAQQDRIHAAADEQDAAIKAQRDKGKAEWRAAKGNPDDV